MKEKMQERILAVSKRIQNKEMRIRVNTKRPIKNKRFGFAHHTGPSRIAVFPGALLWHVQDKSSYMLPE